MSACLDDSSETTTPDDNLDTQALEQTLLPKTRSCDDIVAAVEAASAPTRRLSDPNISTDPNCLLKHEAHKGSEAAAEPADPRLNIDQDIVTFNNEASTDNVEELMERTESEMKNIDAASTEEACTNTEYENGDVRELTLKETVILETSTDTLTGDLADTGAVSRNCSQTSLDTKGQQAESQSAYKSEGVSRQMEALSLEKSASISTSTSEISDSHIGQKQRQQQTNNHKKDSTGLSLHIPDLATMSAAAAAAACAAPPALQKILEQATSSSHASSASGESEMFTPPTMHSRTPSSTSPPTPGMDKVGTRTTQSATFNVFNFFIKAIPEKKGGGLQAGTFLPPPKLK